MSAAAELDPLLNRLVDGLLDEQDAARLQALLAADADARRRYRRFIALDSGLRWDYVAAAREVLPPPQRWTRAPVRWWVPWVGALAASFLFAVTLALWPSYGPRVVLTVSTLSDGTLTWSAGNRRQELGAAGEPVRAGRLVLDGDNAVAVLRFRDGTNLTLTGETELEVDDEAGKRLDLRRGTLSAEVTPQPVGRPLVITTATARLEVVGTALTVDAGADVTTLAVESGTVRMERLADRQAVEVAAGQQASVSFDPAGGIAVIPRPRIPDSWRVDFAQRPPSHWAGTWTAPADGVPGRMAAVPYVAGRDAGGKPITHHGVRVNAPDAARRPFVRLRDDSRVTLRFRLTRSDVRTPLKVMLCLARDGGAFGGTFFASVNPLTCPLDAEGWRTAVFAMPDFLPTRPAVHPTPVGHAITFILANTTARPAGLEVVALAVDQP